MWRRRAGRDSPGSPDRRGGLGGPGAVVVAAAVLVVTGCGSQQAAAPSGTVSTRSSTPPVVTSTASGTTSANPTPSPTGSTGPTPILPTVTVPTPTATGPITEPGPKEQTTVTGVVTVDNDLGRCVTMQIDGRRHLLAGTGVDALRNGETVTVTGSTRTDMASFCQLGPIFQVTKLEKSG